MASASDRPAAPSWTGASAWGDHAQWLVQLRWAAILGVLLTVAICAALDVITSEAPMLIVVGMLATANVVFSHIASEERGRAERPAKVPRSITWQISTDLVALALLLHYSDAARNPFAAFYVFHVAIAGLILPWRTGARLVVLAVAVQGAIVIGEATGMLEHYPLLIPGHAGDSLWQNPTFLAGHLVGLGALLTATLYFTSITASRLRATEARRAEQERLAQSRERLARIGTLAAGVAHGVRTPLHGILSGVDMLQDKLNDDKEAGELLGLINERIEAIDGLTQTLLTLGRGAPPQKDTMDLRLVLEKAARFMSTRAKERNVKLALELPTKVEAEVDADRIAEAVANLLDNAIDASPEGAQVTLRLLEPNDTRPCARIEVQDAGPGIPSEHLSSVFDPFFTTKPVGRGSGLGLAITRRAVDEHGGEIEITSHPGDGTMVRLELPLTQAQA